MRTELPEEVLAFGAAARARLLALGGVRFALQAETDDDCRARAGEALTQLGAWDVDPRAGVQELLAAAELCRAAGSVALPYPLVEQLLSVEGARLALVDAGRPRIDHGDLDGSWRAVDLDGCQFTAAPGARTVSRLGPFVVPADLVAAGGPLPADDVAIHLVLGAWRVLGGLETALGLVTDHVRVRTQFGRPLADFQAVSFALADAVVAVRGLSELGKYTLWRTGTAGPEARSADAVVLRLHAVEVARDVLRTCHQLLGAVGFCDEHGVSVLDRHLQALLRLPCSAEVLVERLLPAVATGAFESLFSAS